MVGGQIRVDHQTGACIGRPCAPGTFSVGECVPAFRSNHLQPSSHIPGLCEILVEKEAEWAQRRLEAKDAPAPVNNHEKEGISHGEITIREPRKDQGVTMPMTTSAGTGSSSRVGQRIPDHPQSLANRRSSMSSNSRVASNSRNAAIEARDRLTERLRGAALLSHRHSNASLPGGFLEEFGLLFDDEEDAWSDDEMWELGIQDWLAAWGYGEGWQADLLSSAEQFSVPKGLSKSMIGSLHKEVFVPKVRRRDKEAGDTSLEQDDCSVCLEHFLAGQLLIHLPCKHRFHPDCLTPWLESHGQCPYCRAKISSEAKGEASSSGGGGASASATVSSSDEDLVALMGLTMR
eukprot:c23562_g1_i2 orf=539-1579(+)